MTALTLGINVWNGTRWAWFPLGAIGRAGVGAAGRYRATPTRNPVGAVDDGRIRGDHAEESLACLGKAIAGAVAGASHGQDRPGDVDTPPSSPAAVVTRLVSRSPNVGPATPA